MRCPFCDNDSTRVVSVTENKEGVKVRRRECLSEDCKERVTTYEVSQIQFINALEGKIPQTLLNRIALLMGITFPEVGENPKDIFDFYFEDVSDF